MDLFPRPRQDIIEKLRRIDIAQTTPIEALNLLSELQNRARSDA